MKITDALIAEHAVFYALLEHLERSLPQAETLGEIKAFARLLEVPLKTHADLEDVLFDALEPSLDQLGKLETVRHDHEAIKKCLCLVHKARTRAEATRLFTKLNNIIRHEFDLEERIIFPMAERLLKAETLKQLGSSWAKARQIA